MDFVEATTKARGEVLDRNLDLGMTFGQALSELKRGKHIRRMAWKSWGAKIYLIDPNFGDCVNDLFIGIQTKGDRVNPWVPTCDNILAEDWEIVE